MKNILVLLLFSFLEINSQTQFQSFLDRVNSITDLTQKANVVDSFIVFARSQGIPFIEDNTANFFYKGSVNSVSIAGDMNGWDANTLKMIRLSGTNFFYFSKNYELNARLDYKFVINNSNWILDPENNKTCLGGFGPNSELAMPQFVQPWEISSNINAPQLTVNTKIFHSNIINRNYSITILLPPDYNSSNNNYPTVYFQDGSDYLNFAYSKNVIQNLLDSSKIAPFIAVFVTPTNRNNEYAEGNRFVYANLFVNELVPYIDSLYRTIPNKHNRLVLGDSFGGNISALIAYTYPETFANCGLHSAAFWPNNYEVFNMIVTGEKKDIKFYSVWGSYEPLLSNLRIFTDTLNSKGYTISIRELPQGHSWGLWRCTLDEILEFFFPIVPVHIENEVREIKNFQLFQNYPNPFNPETVIRFSIAEDNNLSLDIFNVLGQKVLSVFSGFLLKGEYSFKVDAKNLTSGIYFYSLSLKENNKKITKKMTLIK